MKHLKRVSRILCPLLTILAIAPMALSGAPGAYAHALSTPTPSGTPSTSGTPAHTHREPPISRAPNPHIHFKGTIHGRHIAYGRHTQHGTPVGTTPGTTTQGTARAGTAATSCSSSCLAWNGGPVQHNPQIYLIFWGPNWGGITDPNIQTVNTFFQVLAGGQYNNILSQYADSGSDPNAYVHNTVQLDGIWLDSSNPESTVTLDDVRNEANSGLVVNPSWVAGPDTQVFVFPQKGTQYDTSHFQIQNAECAEHDNGSVTIGGVSINIAYSTVLYPYQIGNNGCTSDTDADELTTIASHEYAEAATDPNADDSGYATNCGLFCTSQQEIGDLCDPTGSGPVTTTYTPRDANGNELVIEVQELWSNEANTCVGYRGEEQVSSAYGKHTVYGQLQTAYDALGGISSYRAIRAAKPIR